jgi:hypothetical protein
MHMCKRIDVTEVRTCSPAVSLLGTARASRQKSPTTPNVCPMADVWHPHRHSYARIPLESASVFWGLPGSLRREFPLEEARVSQYRVPPSLGNPVG